MGATCSTQSCKRGATTMGEVVLPKHNLHELTSHRHLQAVEEVLQRNASVYKSGKKETVLREMVVGAAPNSHRGHETPNPPVLAASGYPLNGSNTVYKQPVLEHSQSPPKRRKSKENKKAKAVASNEKSTPGHAVQTVKDKVTGAQPSSAHPVYVENGQPMALAQGVAPERATDIYGNWKNLYYAVV